MPKGPQGQKRRGHIVGCAVDVAHLATGEAEEIKKEASAMGRLGAHARNMKLSPERRSEIARQAVTARWEKARTLKT